MNETTSVALRRIETLFNFSKKMDFSSSNYGQIQLDKISKIKIGLFLDKPELITGEISVDEFSEYFSGGSSITSVSPLGLDVKRDAMDERARRYLAKLVFSTLDKNVVVIWGAGAERSPFGSKIDRLEKGIKDVLDDSFTPYMRTDFVNIQNRVAIDLLFHTLAEPHRHVADLIKIFTTSMDLRKGKGFLRIYTENWTRELIEATVNLSDDRRFEYLENIRYLCHNHFRVEGNTLEIELTRLSHRNDISKFINDLKASDIIIVYGYSTRELGSKPILTLLIPAYFDYFEKKEFHLMDTDAECGEIFLTITINAENPDPQTFFKERIRKIILTENIGFDSFI